MLIKFPANQMKRLSIFALAKVFFYYILVEILYYNYFLNVLHGQNGKGDVT